MVAADILQPPSDLPTAGPALLHRILRCEQTDRVSGLFRIDRRIIPPDLLFQKGKRRIIPQTGHRPFLYKNIIRYFMGFPGTGKCQKIRNGLAAEGKDTAVSPLPSVRILRGVHEKGDRHGTRDLKD